MPSVTIRNVSDETHRAIRARAALHGRSMEAEAREMLESAARAQEQLRLGTLLAEIGRELQLTDEEIALFHSLRDQSPARAACFSTLGNCPDSRVDKSPATPSLPHGYALRNSRRAAFQSG